MDTISSKTKITLKSVVLDVRAGLAALANAQDARQRTYLAGLLCRETATLAEQCLARNAWLNAAYDWIETHKDDLDDEDLKAREDRWLRNLRQYEVAMDLLGHVLSVLPVKPDDVPLSAIPATPPTQEALL